MTRPACSAPGAEPGLPRRPAIPPVAYALVTVLAVERLALGGACGAGCAAAVVITVLLCVVAGVLRRSLRALCALVAVSALCASGLSQLAWQRGERLCDELGRLGVAPWEFVVATEPAQGAYGFRCRAHAMLGGADMGDVWLSVLERLPMGATVRCQGGFQPLEDDAWARSSRMQGAWCTVRVTRVVDRRGASGAVGLVMGLREAILASLDPASRPSRALVAGCVCGSRDALRSHGVDELFSRCGVAHLVAVSGGHLGVLTSLVLSVAVALGMGPRRRFVVVGAAGLLFVVLCGLPVSAVRALCMSLGAMAGSLAGRRAHGLSGASLVGLAMALVDPTLSGQLGFMLSVASVMGLCALSAYSVYALEALLWRRPGHRRLLPRSLSARLRAMRQAAVVAVATSLVAMAVTLPFVAESFGEVSLVSPVANMVVSLPFTLLVGMGMAAGCLWWAPVLQAPLLGACDLLADAIIAFLAALGSVPHAVVPIGADSPVVACSCLVLVLVLVAWPRVSRRHVRMAAVAALALCAVLVMRWRLFAPARICVLDVGQGDAVLVQDGASAVLVDAGPDDSVVSALARQHVLHLDAVVVTHLHEDHYAGLPAIEKDMGDVRVLVARGAARNAREVLGRDVEEVGYGDVLRVGGFAMRVVSPTDAVDGTQNAHSIELVVRYGTDGDGLRALLTGDAERDETGAALANGDLCDIDLLKVGHHGSAVSVTPEQARALDPEVSVASAGEGNSYGHPDPACVGILESAGSRFLCTKDVGDVDVRPGPRGPVVLTARASPADDGL